MKHANYFQTVKCHHNVCLRKFPTYTPRYNADKRRPCCVKYKIVNLFELSDYFYRRTGKFVSLPKTKLEQRCLIIYHYVI